MGFCLRFLNTALANNKGELVIPVIVTGTFHEPQFAPDLQKVAQMKLQKLVPGLDDPAGLTHGMLEEIFRGKPAVPNKFGDRHLIHPNSIQGKYL